MEKTILLKGSGSQFLRQAVEAGLVSGDIQAEIARVTAANEKLELDNKTLKALVSKMRAQAEERRAFVERMMAHGYEAKAKRYDKTYVLGMFVAGLCAGVVIACVVATIAVGGLM